MKSSIGKMLILTFMALDVHLEISPIFESGLLMFRSHVFTPPYLAKL
jgi:hypothetical protein